MTTDDNKVFAYLRVSTDEQDLRSQRLEILEYANHHTLGVDEFVEVEASSRKSLVDRRIDYLLGELKNGDTLIVSELSRLGRSLGQVVRIVEEILAKQARLVAIRENIIIEKEQSITSKVMIAMISLFAEIERDLVSERTRQGIRAARARGARLGRPPGPGRSKLDPYRPEIEALLRNGAPKSFVAKRYGTSAANLAHWLKQREIDATPIVAAG